MRGHGKAGRAGAPAPDRRWGIVSLDAVCEHETLLVFYLLPGTPGPNRYNFAR
jgi:hypothetical protein